MVDKPGNANEPRVNATGESVGDITQVDFAGQTPEMTTGTPGMQMNVVEQQLNALKQYALQNPDAGIDLNQIAAAERALAFARTVPDFDVSAQQAAIQQVQQMASAIRVEEGTKKDAEEAKETQQQLMSGVGALAGSMSALITTVGAQQVGQGAKATWYDKQNEEQEKPAQRQEEQQETYPSTPVVPFKLGGQTVYGPALRGALTMDTGNMFVRASQMDAPLQTGAQQRSSGVQLS